MSYDSRHIDGDVTVGRNAAIGGDATIQGRTHLKGNVKIDGWLDAKNIKGPNKGIFSDAGQLRKAYPLPHDGWWALVGDTLPAPLYLADGGEWVPTGKSAGNPTVGFNNPGPGKGLAGPQDKQSATAGDRLFVYATNSVTNGVAQSKATVLNCPDTLLKQKNGKLSLQKGLWNPDGNNVFVDDNEVPVATSESDGAMSAADKTKMDSLPDAERIATTEDLDSLSQRMTGVSHSSSAYTDPFISLGELNNWEELSDTLDTLYEKKYMGRCRATAAGMNVEIYQFVQNFADKTFSQVVLGNVAPSEDGTQVVIKTVEHFDILSRYCINEVWSVWKSVSKQDIPVATTEKDGLMSSLDKQKVNTLGTGTLGTRVEIGTDTKIDYRVKIGNGTEIGTGVIIDNQIFIKEVSVDGKTIQIGTDRNFPGIQIEKVGDHGVKIGSATLGGYSGDECYIGSGAYVGDNAFLGTGTHIDEGVRIGTDYGVTVDSSNIRIGTSVFIDRNVSIGKGASIGGIDISPTTTWLGTAVGIGNEVRIGNSVRLFNVVKDNATYHTFGKSIIGDNAKVYGVVGTDTTIGTDVGIGNGVKIDEGMWITKDGASGFYIGTENHKVYLDKGDDFEVKIGSATIGRDVTIGHDVTIEKYPDKFIFGTNASLGRNSIIGENVRIGIYTSAGNIPTDYIFGESTNNLHNIVISNENNQRYRLGTGDTASYIGTNVELKANAYIGENAALGNAAGIDAGIYISATGDGKLHIDGDAGQDVYIGRPSYLGIGARVEDGVHVGTNVTVDNTNNMNEIVLGEANAYRIGTSVVQQSSGIKIGEDIRIGRNVRIGDPDTLLGFTGVDIGDCVNIGYGVDIEKDGDDICFMRRMPDQADITLKSRSYLGGSVYEDVEIGTGVKISKNYGNEISIGSAYLGNGAKMWGYVEIGTGVKINANLTWNANGVVISNGEGKTITLNWDN